MVCRAMCCWRLEWGSSGLSDTERLLRGWLPMRREILLVVRGRLLQLCVRDQVVLDPKRSVLVGQEGFDLHLGCRFFSGISERREWGELLQLPFSRVVVQVAAQNYGACFRKINI